MSLARTERAALAQTLLSVGPDAPTMCEGWVTRDLAVHLVVRESRPDALVASALPVLRRHARSVNASYAGLPWTELVGTVADGPPLCSPFRPLDAVVNLAEMFVHHEDVLRGGADPDGPFLPRKVSPEMERALERSLRIVGRMTLAKAPARVTLGSVDGREILSAGRGEPVAVNGRIGELLLFAFGRAPVDLVFAGAPEAVDALRRSDRSV